MLHFGTRVVRSMLLAFALVWLVVDPLRADERALLDSIVRAMSEREPLWRHVSAPPAVAPSRCLPLQSIGEWTDGLHRLRVELNVYLTREEATDAAELYITTLSVAPDVVEGLGDRAHSRAPLFQSGGWMRLRRANVVAQ